MPKRTTRSKVSASDRKKVLAEIKAGRMTTKQAAKKLGISHWTIYGWKKNRTSGRAATRGPAAAAGKKRAASAKTSSVSTRRADRARILAEMSAMGLTAQQAAKKYGISKWTIYGWRKRRGGGAATRGGKMGRPAARSGSGDVSAAVRAEVQMLLPSIVREEIVRVLTGAASSARAGSRRRRKK